jgi:hypothetical protein
MRLSDLPEAIWRPFTRTLYTIVIALLAGTAIFLLVLLFTGNGKSKAKAEVPAEPEVAAAQSEVEEPPAAAPSDDADPRAELRAKLAAIARQPNVFRYTHNEEHVLPRVTVIVETEVTIENRPSASAK